MQLEDYTDDRGLTQPGLKSQYKNHVTVTETNLLEKTDWMYVRQKERDISVPLDVVSNRTAIANEADRVRGVIDKATSEEEVISAFQSASWPEDN